MDANISEITIVDPDDGTHYTLNVAAQEIRASTGEVLALDGEQTLLALGAFHGTVETDPSVHDLENLNWNYCSLGGPCQTSVDGSGGGSGDIAMIFRVVDSDVSKKSAKPIKKAKHKSDSEFAVSEASDPCWDVANAALGKTIEYKRVRTSFLREGFAMAVKEGAKLFLKAGTDAALSFANLVTDHTYARTSVGILAWHWNAYNCGNRSVVAGPIIRTAGWGGGGSGRTLECHYERWEISFDGGATWQAISVRVCEWVMM